MNKIFKYKGKSICLESLRHISYRHNVIVFSGKGGVRLAKLTLASKEEAHYLVSQFKRAKHAQWRE